MNTLPGWRLCARAQLLARLKGPFVDPPSPLFALPVLPHSLLHPPLQSAVRFGLATLVTAGRRRSPFSINDDHGWGRRRGRGWGQLERVPAKRNAADQL